jgi:hypothetical protein
MIARRRLAAACLLASLLRSVSAAAELLPADRPIHQVIDHYVDERLKAEGVVPAPQANGPNLLRRLMLDLAGRIATPAEAQPLAAVPVAEWRAKLVDRLLASDDFARHQRSAFEAMFFPDGRAEGAFGEYLLQAFRENRPWDRMFREIIADKDIDKQPLPQLAFLKNRASDVDRMTADVSSLFLGVNISCAQCHDHPLVSDWKQDHFYGLRSFLSATYFSKAKTLAEREEVETKFKTSKGVTKEARLMFLTGAELPDPLAALSADERAKLKKNQQEAEKSSAVPPPPKFSRRAMLVELALGPQGGDYFARSIVNRVWHRLLGHGLVNPVDQMHSANEPTHSQLLDWLARDLKEHNFDLRRLVRGIVLSDAYSRSSRWLSGQRPPADLFAVAQVKPLSPRELGMSFVVASAAPGAIKADLGTPEWNKRLEQLDSQARGLASMFELPGDNFQVGVTEALLLSNSERIAGDLLRDSPDRLVGKLKAIPDRKEAIATAIWNVYGRPAEPEELQALEQFLAARRERLTEGYQQMLWALLTSSEFRFNY